MSGLGFTLNNWVALGWIQVIHTFLNEFKQAIGFQRPNPFITHPNPPKPTNLTPLHSLNQGDNWVTGWSSSSNKCDPLGLCGLNSYCTLMDQEPTCTCPLGFDFVDQDKKILGCQRNFTDGCISKNKEMFNLQLLEAIAWEDNPFSIFSSNKDDRERQREKCDRERRERHGWWEKEQGRGCWCEERERREKHGGSIIERQSAER